MPHEPTHTPPGDDASWESLAENLFGIEFKQPGLSEDLAAEDLDLEEELLGPPAKAERAEASQTERDAVATAAPDGVSCQAGMVHTDTPVSRLVSESDLDFGADLGLEDDFSFDEPAVPEPAVRDTAAATTRGANESARDASAEEDVRLLEAQSSAWEPNGGLPNRRDELEDDFAADLDLADEELSDELLSDEDESLTDELDEADEPAEAGEADTYWDALKDWEWDDTDEPTAAADPSARRPAGRGGRGGRTSSYVPRAVVEPEQPAWAEGRDEFIEDPDFGTGLLEDESSRRDVQPAEPVAPVGERTAEQPPARRDRRDDEDHSGSGRRGRRRRRGRGGRAEPAETAPARAKDEPDELEEFEMEDRDVAAEVEPRRSFEDAELESADADEFGLGLDVEPAEQRREPAEREQRRGRRRRPHRRERSETEPGAPSAGRERETREPVAERWSEPGESEDDLAEEPEAAHGARWENVPTWEEAVAMLVGRRPASGREASSRDSPESGGRDEGRGERSSRARGRGGRRPRRSR